MRLEGKVIIVTGSARGLGKAYALALAKEGATIVVSDILSEEANQTVDEIRRLGGIGVAVRTDVSLESDTTRLAEETVRNFGRIDCLINNAAIFFKGRPFFEIDSAEWDKVLAVNLRGPWLCIKAVFPYMKQQLKGKIVNISSGTFFVGVPGQAHYIASKGGIVGLTRALCRELGEYNITINAIAPGYTMTEAAEAMYPDPGHEVAMKQARALKRNQHPDDLVGTVVYLCSGDSDFLTGQTILVDGGRIMH